MGATELKDAGFEDKDVLKVGIFSPDVLKEAGYSASDLKNAGHPVSSFLSAGFTISELKHAGFTMLTLWKMLALKKLGFTPYDRLLGYRVAPLWKTGYTK